MMPPPLIALISDFGYDDPYTAIMKGIISEISPQTRLIDLTHNIPPGDIQRGAFVTWQSANDFPPGTVFLAVIDPGVGTERKGICVKCQDQIFIGPDNGLFSYLYYNSDFQAWDLTNRDYQLPNLSSTFHGRDIFAPAAAHCTQGVTPDQFGNPVPAAKTLPTPTLSISESIIKAEILSSDHFGNLFTTIGRMRASKDGLALHSWINSEQAALPHPADLTLRVENQDLNLVNTFGSLSPGDCAGVIGSTGLLEIVCNQGSAVKIFNGQVGDPVQLLW